MVLWFLFFLVSTIGAYFLSYWRFKRLIAQQTKQMISLMKSDDIESIQIGDIYTQADADFSDLERAAMSLRKKYLRLKKLSQRERSSYETVFSGLKEAIVSVDQNLRIISFNSAFMNFFNWAPVKETSHYFLQDVIRDPQIIGAFKKTFELDSVTKSDVERFQLFVTPLASRNENEEWCLGVFYDLSEIRKTEKIRIDFVANASHEMRTPLTVIKGFSELLRNKFLNDKRADELEMIKPIVESADHMSDLMDELLNLSKVESGSVMVKEKIATTDLTESVLREIEPLLNLNQKKIKIEYGAQEVFANQESSRQILRNLIINAVKYSGNSDFIIVRWKELSDRVLLSIIDNGPGIPKEHQDRIFERFYRVDKGRGREQGGFGLGLALVKHHMLNHGGAVRLDSQLGRGSEFICEFPKEFTHPAGASAQSINKNV